MASVVSNVPPNRLGAVFTAQANALPKIARAGLRAGVERGRTLVISRTPVGLPPGQMRQAWAVFPYGALGWTLDNDAPHAGVVEGGARPHAVSKEGVDAIREWVARVLQLGQMKAGPHKGQRRKLTKRERETDRWKREIDSITWAIVAKLREEGQEPRWVVRGVLDTLARLAGEETAAAVEAYLSRSPEGAR